MRLTLVLSLVALLAACSGQKGDYPYQTKYLPVMIKGSSKWSLMDVSNGEIVVKDAYAEAPSAVISDMYYVPQQDGTLSYYNISDPKTPVATGYGSGTEFSDDGYALATKRGGKINVIDKQGKSVAELADTVVQASMFCRGLAIFTTSSGKSGYIDTKGQVVIPAKYDAANPFLYADQALVLQQRQEDSLLDVIFIDKAGKVLFNTNTSVYAPNRVSPYFNHGVIPVLKHDSVVCLNAEGKEVANPFVEPDTIKKAGFTAYSRDGMGNYIVAKGDKMGLVDKGCKTLMPIKYLAITDLTADRYLVSEKQGEFYLTDAAGKRIGNAVIVDVQRAPGSKALRGYVDMEDLLPMLMSKFDDQSFAGGINAQTQVANFLQLLDAAHPERYAGQSEIPISNDVAVKFAGPIASQTAPGNYSFNMTTTVTSVTTVFDASPYSTDTEPQLIDLMAQNMGKVGFVNAGNNVFTSESGTAVSVGYEQGVVRIIYWMHAADAKPLPAQKRK